MTKIKKGIVQKSGISTRFLKRVFLLNDLGEEVKVVYC
jgi:hypothetical protein